MLSWVVPRLAAVALVGGAGAGVWLLTSPTAAVPQVSTQVVAATTAEEPKVNIRPLYNDGREASERRLDRLFRQLKETRDPLEAKSIQSEIFEIWAAEASPAITVLYVQGVEALADEAYEVAAVKFDAVVEHAPDFAEGWNKRAELRYRTEDFVGAVHDIQHVLALEPRHFGALLFLGQIFVELGNNKGALQAYEAVLKFNPHVEGLALEVERLRTKVQGSEI